MSEIHIDRKGINELDKIKRINLINSITGIKPANLIGTCDKNGNTNLAIFSSVIHLGSNPPLVGMISRPEGEVERHTIENIKSIGYYTINHVPVDKIEHAHYTSAKFSKSETEFEKCDFKEYYADGFSAPFVAESPIKFGLELKQIIPIELNNTILIIGEVAHIITDDNLLSSEYYMDLQRSKSVGISGLNSYYSLERINSFPYARKEELPDLKTNN